MRGLRAALARMAGLLGASRRDRELADEIDSHLAMHIDDNMRAGMTAGQARREALIALGGVEATKEMVRDRRGVPAVETLWRDVRYAARSLGRSPAFATVAVLALALGIGGNTAIFTVVNAVLIEPLPFRDAGRLTVIWEESARRPGHPNVVSPANFLRWRERATAFEEMAGFYDWRAQLSGEAEPEEVPAQNVTPNFFPALGVAPRIGRDFAPDEGPDGHDQVVILGHGLWQRRFGGERSAVGRSISINGRPFTIIGVMPPGVQVFLEAGSLVGRPAELWTPFAFTEAMRQPRGRYMSAIGRIKPGVSLAGAQAQMATIAAGLAAEFPGFDTGWTVRLVPIHEELSAALRPALLVLSAAVAFVLLIACANVANLLLARGAARQHEIALRVALGASRARVVRQLLTESLVLGALGGAAGLLVAHWSLALLTALRPDELAGLGEVRLSYPILAFTAVVSLLTSVIFGLAPAVEGSRTEPRASLGDGARQVGAGRRGRRLRQAFVVSQVALALVLLAGAGLMLRSFGQLRAVDPGFDARNVLTARVTLPRARYQDEAKARQFFGEAVARMRALPGVQAAGMVSYLPLAGLGSATRFEVVGQPPPAPGQEPVTDVRVCDNGYFRTMNVPLVRGRLFTGREMQEKSDVVVISQAMARQYFRGQDPIGQRVVIHMTDPNVPTTVVGVVGDVRHADLTTEPRAMAYWPHPQLPVGSMTLTVRAAADGAAIEPAMRAAIRGLDRELPLADVRTMGQWVAKALAGARFSSTLLAVFAGLALLLAATGIYGVLAYAVSQRTAEIGIRVALGADRRAIAGMVVGSGARLVVAGLAIGLPLAALLNRALGALLYQTPPGDPLTYAVVVGVLGAAALAASYLPARRAARIAPMEAIRRQ